MGAISTFTVEHYDTIRGSPGESVSFGLDIALQIQYFGCDMICISGVL